MDETSAFCSEKLLHHRWSERDDRRVEKEVPFAHRRHKYDPGDVLQGLAVGVGRPAAPLPIATSQVRRASAEHRAAPTPASRGEELSRIMLR